jgi:hypothetical protein
MFHICCNGGNFLLLGVLFLLRGSLLGSLLQNRLPLLLDICELLIKVILHLNCCRKLNIQTSLSLFGRSLGELQAFK